MGLTGGTHRDVSDAAAAALSRVGSPRCNNDITFNSRCIVFNVYNVENQASILFVGITVGYTRIQYSLWVGDGIHDGGDATQHKTFFVG